MFNNDRRYRTKHRRLPQTPRRNKLTTINKITQATTSKTQPTTDKTTWHTTTTITQHHTSYQQALTKHTMAIFITTTTI